MPACGIMWNRQALGYFQSRVQAILQTHNKSVLFWDEFWAAGLPALNSTVAEIRSTTFAETLTAGRRAITTVCPVISPFGPLFDRSYLFSFKL